MSGMGAGCTGAGAELAVGGAIVAGALEAGVSGLVKTVGRTREGGWAGSVVVVCCWPNKLLGHAANISSARMAARLLRRKCLLTLLFIKMFRGMSNIIR